jgi:small subunit ribosomal protein S21
MASPCFPCQRSSFSAAAHGQLSETLMPSDAIQCKPLEVVVSDRGIERAIKMLKRKLASEGVLRELKMRRHYMKPSVKRRKKQAEAARRRRKRARMDAAPPKP